MISKSIAVIGLVLTLALGMAGCSKPPPPADSALFNREAGLPADLPFNPFDWRVVTSYLTPADGTMSTLYGNDSAIASARSGAAGAYPAGSVLALVTWYQKDDIHWFGGRIPARIKSIEFVSVEAASDTAPATTPSYSYQDYEGIPLAQLPPPEGPALQAQIDAIVKQRAAVLP